MRVKGRERIAALFAVVPKSMTSIPNATTPVTTGDAVYPLAAFSDASGQRMPDDEAPEPVSISNWTNSFAPVRRVDVQQIRTSDDAVVVIEQEARAVALLRHRGL